MKVRGWLLIGDERAAQTLPQHMALTGSMGQPNLPNAGEVEPGRWIVYQPGLVGPMVTMVCIEIPLP